MGIPNSNVIISLLLLCCVGDISKLVMLYASGIVYCRIR